MDREPGPVFSSIKQSCDHGSTSGSWDALDLPFFNNNKTFHM